MRASRVADETGAQQQQSSSLTCTQMSTLENLTVLERGHASSVSNLHDQTHIKLPAAAHLHNGHSSEFG